MQQITENALINLANRLYNETGSDNICLAGGVALNCVANGKIIPNTGFKNIFVQPAAHDAGTAIGAAYYIWNQILAETRVKPLKNVYLGPEYSEEEIRETLDKNGMNYKKVENAEKHIALLISQGNIIAWFDGKMEGGPRALGNRSILADPRSPVIRDELNRKVKFREVFRPFCPCVLEQDAKEWFETDQYYDPAYYMLIACMVKSDKADLIPSVTHVDKTARIQLVTKETNERYFRLLSEFKKLTGVPVLLNTSFNIQEPIVCSPQDAVNTFRRSDMDCLVIGGYMIEKREGDEWGERKVKSAAG
ncbi:MAG: carbamoyltransferase [Desulfobacteraceae bacterium]|nr:carbamoyltransferase [Desulfobacteraceae bacterium]